MIDDFTGKHAFLSNFYPSLIVFDKKLYKTVEHAYQAFKAVRPIDHEMIRCADSPTIAKKLGRTIQVREEFEIFKLSIMEDLLREKFKNWFMRERLYSTGEEEIVEGNTWGDTFWGKVNHVGLNHLGRLLMKIRDDRNGQAKEEIRPEGPAASA